jgi:hypothetical protein
MDAPREATPLPSTRHRLFPESRYARRRMQCGAGTGVPTTPRCGLTRERTGICWRRARSSTCALRTHSNPDTPDRCRLNRPPPRVDGQGTSVPSRTPAECRPRPPRIAVRWCRNRCSRRRPLHRQPVGAAGVKCADRKPPSTRWYGDRAPTVGHPYTVFDESPNKRPIPLHIAKCWRRSPDATHCF